MDTRVPPLKRNKTCKYSILFSLQFPDCDSDEDEEFKSQNQALKSSIPFAVVAGTHSMEISGKAFKWVLIVLDQSEKIHAHLKSL